MPLITEEAWLTEQRGFSLTLLSVKHLPNGTPLLCIQQILSGPLGGYA
jgi:hypothetical protein